MLTYIIIVLAGLTLIDGGSSLCGNGNRPSGRGSVTNSSNRNRPKRRSNRYDDY